jgi:hypothetical protein
MCLRMAVGDTGYHSHHGLRFKKLNFERCGSEKFPLGA